ncbi:hypothetical protein AVEN_218810-1 [Araneus ventricosus]|uniref:Uncharacterized protein n=1 Tax=Araneus ventricosus TaxID=182803 RepID=A0A4Y2B5Q2_ARAVE|nr:hypothetical protein AVEN_218810-1 [Araneus ventricosus]
MRVQRNGAVSGFIFRKKKSNPPPNFVIMAATKGNSNTAIDSDSLVARAKPDKKKKNRQKVAVLDSVPVDSAEDFKVPKRSDKSGSGQKGALGSTGLGRVLTGPGTAGPTYRFGQSNPFALPKVPSSGSGSKVDSTPGKGYIGFGLSSGLPVGTAWGDTPFPGSLAAARLMGQARQDSTVGVPPTEKPSDIPSGMEVAPAVGAQRVSVGGWCGSTSDCELWSIYSSSY